MQDDDRQEIMEKRSSLRSWRERGKMGKRMPRRNEILGIGLIVVIFIAVLASGFTGGESQDSEFGEPLQKETPVPAAALPSEESHSSLTLMQ
jgi:hypothetical protein